MKDTNVVFPIAPSFTHNGEELDLVGIYNYLRYLEANGVSKIMTTAGTSQFNLMSIEETKEFNRIVAQSSIKSKIIGVPQMNLKETVDYANGVSEYTDSPVMLLFPERFYSEKLVVDFFETCSREIVNPIYIHGMWTRASSGGIWDFSSSTINRLSEMENIIGMKEETSEIGKAFGIISNLTNKEFDVILAGGSQKRHWFISAVRNCSFLSGAGSLFPALDLNYMKSFQMGNLAQAKSIIEEYETPLFHVFMSIGWHYAMRHALRKMGYISYNRMPFPDSLGSDMDLKIENITNELISKYNTIEVK